MRSHHGVISSRAALDRAQVRRMVREIASRHALSNEMIDGVGERTGGIPLFVEEVTRLLLEHDAQGGAQAIPPTLQQSLAARLDRLGEAREVAQIGVLARDFSYPLFARSGVSTTPPYSRRSTLADADLVIVEAAHGATIASSTRLSETRPTTACSRLPPGAAPPRRGCAGRRRRRARTIAHHFTEAGLDDLAIEWWGKAGDQLCAARRSRRRSPISARRSPWRTRARRRGGRQGGAAPTQRLTPLRVAYGNALLQARGFGAPETTQTFARARESASWQLGCDRTIGGRLRPVGRQLGSGRAVRR